MVAATITLPRALTAVDWIIIAFTVLMAVWGFGQGLIAGGLALVGFAAGAFLGARLGPLLLEEGSHSPYAPLFALIGALMLGSLFASGLEVIGFELRHRLPEELGAGGRGRGQRAPGAASACSSSGSRAPWRSRRRARASCASRSSAPRS